MGCLLYLFLCLICFAQSITAQRFLVTAPSVFHVGVKEQVSVQVCASLMNSPVTCLLEQEVGSVPMSNRETTRITQEGQVGILEIEVNAKKAAELLSANGEPPYLNLVCNIGGIKRKQTRVLISQHRGYIFIQTDQPVYNPTQKVQYRIFLLDHAMRPKSDDIYVYLINAEGSTLKKTLYHVSNGLFSRNFHIPDVSQPGVWKIKAHSKGDDRNATIREFKVQKFVLPSFSVSIEPEAGYLLVSTESFKFTIDALYSYGKTISGGFHCRFGVKEETDIKFIKGLEITGPVKKGKAEVTIQVSELKDKLLPMELESLAQKGALFYAAATVTDTISGEVQESEIFLPIVSQRYKVDLSRTRSHYTPNMPFDLVVMVSTPNGPPAAHVQVSIDVPVATEKSKTQHTNEEGMTIFTVNLEAILPVISFEITVDGFKLTKEVSRVTSLRNSFLYISVTNKVVLPGHSLNVAFNILNGNPEDGRIYYMVLNKGILKKTSSLIAADLTKISLAVSSDMTPSFRLIGYYYDTNGEIIADSVWVDVKDVCEGKIEVTENEPRNFYSPGNPIDINIDVGKQSDARVALLAVDKAIYALNAQNKLTPKQVFSSMQSYDLGCSYGGGTDTAAVFNGAGLAFISHSQTVRSQMRRGFGCESGFRRQRRSIDLHKQMAEKESMYKNTTLKKCCRHGLTLIPMRLTCEERKKRIVRTESAACVEAFMKCCQFATQLREKKRQEDIRSGHGRSTNIDYIEDFFENDVDHIRRSFPPSFEFRDFKVNGKTTYKIYAPDSITTWEVQAVSLSSSHGFCVAKPVDIRVFKELFVSLRLPYSVKRNEQLALLVVIYNYGTHERQLAVHMKQVDGLCSPGASSTASYTNVNLGPQSSETVTFSAVPLIDGEIPITIVLYDREMEMGVDAIQRTLLVMTEGVRMQEEKSFMINLDGRSSKYIHIDGMFPNSTVPETDTNVFVKIEGEPFSMSAALPLLSPSSVERLIRAPIGCAEQTMIRMSPTALSIRFLDSSSHWLELAAGSRDTALDHLEKGYERILTFKKPDGSYGAWQGHPTSNWLTALVVKVLSLASNLVTTANQRIISQVDIQDAAMYLIKKQNDDGSFTDPNPVIHREMQGGIGGMEQDASLTAFVTVALNHSLPFLGQNTQPVEDSISRATDYLLLRIGELERPYAVAITAYCLSTCLKNHALALSAWMKLKSLAVVEGECKVWRARKESRVAEERQAHLVPPAMALTVETTAYALLTALAQGDLEEAKAAACFLSTQENYEGGFRSTQDTIMALEALSVYTVQKPASAFDGISAQFTSPLRNTMEKVVLNKKDEKVEAELKRLLGGDITAKLSGNGDVKIKVAKAYYALDPYNACDHISIDVTVKGKVEYTAQVMANYNYYGNGDYEDGEMEEGDFPRSAIEWFDARSRRRRDTEGSSEDTVVYEVCVSHSLERNISGMAVADITLLSGFEPIVEELDKLKDLSDKYISHYEVSKGRVLLYFNEILDGRECITFEAKQTVPIGLVQPAPATFYDYYEPDRRCSVFYSAPKRSKMVSVLCSEDVCQCAERPCFKEKKSLESLIQKGDRFKFACYYPVVDYGFVVTVLSVDEASNFQLFSTNVTEVLKNNRDTTVDVGDIRVFAKRKHCKGQLETGKTYLIMGNDGSTTDSRGQMQYLLDSNTWVEQKFDAKVCRASVNRKFCKELKDFLREYQINGCSQ
ncbi:complement C4-B [Electrophorus electricus]|uniref:Complement 4B (Chido blood group) n=1 Tax=Electrophorus electricus TaxID=8005 RepID=A0A4W4FSF7_ELEEL|nr:complement C4-B [Electrophorus electricus]